ncbi:PREDICTED: 1-aminocyclopropane-1-carboxylate oxidase 5 [Nelumbo nucifera]|uniref:1-aminocyclopropane-1-carboxylate oxidase 5 n=2 Tax=Nelumbo nucifera TaxID=4432 RepID=A0A1U8AW19_NELNU|nr:PREDICTED: 1-aminocyclopropane-1-carboxylate oxidase 5 [Nelumbo nucifera]DAD48860.1 TPA_asm: hypothetical protein HUJ06_018797 [Nelumbo nucifera]
MPTSPGALPANQPDFRAPPPSPIGNAIARRPAVVNEDEITEFLEHSLRVPDLILPEQIFPRQIPIGDPPEIDFESISLLDKNSISKVLEPATVVGCFQIVNHGISADLIRSVSAAADGLFRISSENKATVLRSSAKLYGFEEFSGGEESDADTSEEFVWCMDDGLNSVMERIWPDGYSNFSAKMKNLSKEVEKVANKVFLHMLSESTLIRRAEKEEGQEFCDSMTCIYKHRRNIPAARCISSLKSDVIRMLIRGSDYSHALCVHICEGSSEFHVYSKKGWMSFSPNKDAIVVTVGDRIQVWSGGQYRHVVGRPIFRVEDDEDPISMAFLYSPPTISHQSPHGNRNRTISLGQQAITAILLILAYHFLLYIYNKF